MIQYRDRIDGVFSADSGEEKGDVEKGHGEMTAIDVIPRVLCCLHVDLNVTNVVVSVNKLNETCYKLNKHVSLSCFISVGNTVLILYSHTFLPRDGNRC